jgi:hypothetical protein
MRRKRPCRICRRWFVPHPGAGDRQHVCSAVDCQRERHWRACPLARARARSRRSVLTGCAQRLRVDVSGPQGAAELLGSRVALCTIRQQMN